MKKNSISAMNLVLAIFALGVCAVCGQAQSVSLSCNLQAANSAVLQHDNYSAMKALEGCFHVPANSASALVGTFDPATGNFTYSQQVTPKQMPLPLAEVQIPGSRAKPGLTGTVPAVRDVPAIVGLVPLNAVNAGLTFQSANGQPIQVAAKQLLATWSQTAGIISGVSCGAIGPGCPWSATALPASWSVSGSPATVNVGQASAVEFTLSAGAKSYTGFLLIVRPPVIGVGAFTVPAIPLSIVYAPPLGLLKKNTNSYSIATTAGTSISMTVTQDNSTTTPMDFMPIGPVFANDVQNAVSKIPGLSSIPGGFGAALNGEMWIINQITGSISGNTTQGVTTTQNRTLNVSFTNKAAWTTEDYVGGPGLEDIFIFLNHPQFIWEAYGGHLRVSMINGALDMKAAHYLLENKDNPQGFDGLDSATIKNLLALDPFTAPYVNVPYSSAMATINGIVLPGYQVPAQPLIPARWADNGEDILSDSDSNFSPSNQYQVSTSDSSTTANYSASALDAQAGMLSFLGTGDDVSQTQTQNSKTTITTSLTTTDTQIVTAQANFWVEPNEKLDVEAYYDVPLGTFAFVPKPTPSQPAYAAIALSAAGQPLPNQLVILQVAGKRYTTKTDAHGRYAFYSGSLKAGTPAVLVAGGVSKQVVLGAPIATTAIPVRPVTTVSVPARK